MFYGTDSISRRILRYSLHKDWMWGISKNTTWNIVSLIEYCYGSEYCYEYAPSYQKIMQPLLNLSCSSDIPTFFPYRESRQMDIISNPIQIL